MDVDRERYIPYWSPDAKLLDAMLKPAPAEHGPLAGETGGLVGSSRLNLLSSNAYTCADVETKGALRCRLDAL